MNQKEFISGIKVAVADSATEALKSTLTAPSGREPAEHLVKLSKWYNSLNENDKTMVIRIIDEAVDTSIFGFLCVLDGVRTIEESKDKGMFKLYYQKGKNNIMLNDPNEDYLHDIW